MTGRRVTLDHCLGNQAVKERQDQRARYLIIQEEWHSPKQRLASLWDIIKVNCFEIDVLTKQYLLS